MSETTPASTPAPVEKTVVVNNSLCRLWTLTILSLCLSGLILVLFIVGAIIHCHHRHHGFGGPEGGRGGPREFSRMDERGGHDFHRFGGDFGRHGDRDRRNFDRGNNSQIDGSGGPRPGMGMGGMRGMMGGGKNGPPDPAKMTDMVLNHLSEKLVLTDDQKAKLKPILADQVATIQKQMEAQRAAMQKAMEDAKVKIKTVLTPDQQKQLDAMPMPGQKPPTPDQAPPK